MIDCCKMPADSANTGPRLLCPQCGCEGQPVERTTVQALLKPEAQVELNGNHYRLCEARNCPVVYYDGNGARFSKEQLRVRVGVKETEDPVPVCYCFGVTEQMIHEEVRQTGRSSASARIRAEVKDGNCRCAVENPSGRCCLGEVIWAEKRSATEIKGRCSAYSCS